MEKTPLQELIEKLEAVRDNAVKVAPERADAYHWTIDYIKESLLPTEKQFAEKCFEAGFDRGQQKIFKITSGSEITAPDFPTYWKQNFETEGLPKQ